MAKSKHALSIQGTTLLNFGIAVKVKNSLFESFWGKGL